MLTGARQPVRGALFVVMVGMVGLVPSGRVGKDVIGRVPSGREVVPTFEGGAETPLELPEPPSLAVPEDGAGEDDEGVEGEEAAEGDGEGEELGGALDGGLPPGGVEPLDGGDEGGEDGPAGGEVDGGVEDVGGDDVPPQWGLPVCSPLPQTGPLDPLAGTPPPLGLFLLAPVG